MPNYTTEEYQGAKIVIECNNGISEQIKDICKSALEKQIPKKPISKYYDRTRYVKNEQGYIQTESYYNYFCPVCKKSLEKGKGCDNNDCRQAIDWEGV